MKTEMKTQTALFGLTSGLRLLAAGVISATGTWRSRHTAALLLFIGCLFVQGAGQLRAQGLDSTQSAATAQPRPTIWTDKVDYEPGSTAVISGAGFLPGETVTLLVLHADGTSDSEAGHQEWTTVANAVGQIQTQWQVADDHYEGTILRAMATGRTSGLIASVRFSDPVENIVYLRSTHSSPWGYGSNDVAMNRVFGTDQWLDLRYETVNVASMLSNAKFIYMEGSDQNADTLEAFLNAHRVDIEAWVTAGGKLFINAAPLQGDGIPELVFGVTLNYAGVTDTTFLTSVGEAAIGTGAAAAHPILNGPFLPVGTSWNGTLFGHATIEGEVTALIRQDLDDTDFGIVLAEKTVGAGRVLFGGMTAVEFHSSQIESSNLRANILSYTLQGAAANIAPSFTAVPTENVLLGAVSATPTITAIKFEWLATGGSDALTFYVNGVQASPALNANVGGGNVNLPEAGSFVTTAPATLAAFAVNGTNSIRMTKTAGTGTRFGWSAMTVLWSDGTEIRTAVVEVLPFLGAPANIDELSIDVAGWVSGTIDSTATFFPAELATDPRPAVTISGVTGGEIWQPVTMTAVSGNPAVVNNVTITTHGGTRILKYNPVAYGTANITVTANDGYPANNSSSQTFVINVIPLADAGPDFGVMTGASVTLSGSLLTPNVDTIAYSWVQTAGTAVTLSNPNTRTPSFTAPVSPATLRFALTITGNGQASVADEVEVAVSAPTMNSLPVANAGPDQLVTGGSVVTLNGSGSADNDNDQLTYGWTQVSGPTVTLIGANTVYPTFATARGNATLGFELKVSDGHGIVADQVQINVSNGVVPSIARPALVNVQSALGTIPGGVSALGTNPGGVSNKADRKTLDRAIESVADAVNSTYWIDDNHLVCPKGKKVFDDIKAAAQTLEKLIKSNKTPGLAALLQPQLNNLVGTANLLPSIAYNDLLDANPASPALAAVLAEFVKADAAAADGKAAKAIGYYKKAWCGVCSVASDPGDDDDN
jgi:hypothetical protein